MIQRVNYSCSCGIKHFVVVNPAYGFYEIQTLYCQRCNKVLIANAEIELKKRTEIPAGTPMDFSDALKALKAGYKVHRIGWGGCMSWVIKQGDNLMLQYAEKAYRDSYYRPRTEDLLAIDWQIVE